jgi:steroid 5-alpha reductase family enzyme
MSAALFGLLAALALALATWGVSVVKRDVSIVDSVWSLLILAAATVYAATLGVTDARAMTVLGLVTLWALRLALYITARNWGEPEDRRYQAIRARNEPNFSIKSLYLVFVLQAVLAWIVSLSLFGALQTPQPWGVFDSVGAALVAFGLVYETVADWQMSRFKHDPANHAHVMDRGLWRHTRHPNYFGECCVWWGFFLFAAASGAWWALVSPVLMSVLLLKVSGVTLLEQDIGERRPAYRDYVARTNAFFPGPLKS